ncbi:alpha/beta fold hydrolase [Streptomyces diacarni]|uniref:Alpha/beta fold hydrolase n=1 Tax=Streptomyces diacarni TaxID=2800381 RepID=A0A367E8N9_9ACTN|nr:alpha/beta fold hydrolase [Streptomyces diacarni]RCG14426.1 alpha/beta fold hydrolase [Streptomyces diacarni]
MNETWTLDRTYASPAGTVRWTALGDPALPPVVLLHGTPWSSFVWRDTARALAEDHHVFVWDMPGYGTSAKYEGQDVSLDAQGRLFAALLEHWGLERPAVVAHDFGGAVALRAHLLHGARFARLALVDVVALAPWGSGAYRLLGEHAEVFAQLPPALHGALVREYVASVGGPGLRQEVIERLAEPWTGEEGQPALYRQMAQNGQRWTDEIEHRYGGLALPVLVCWGTEDAWIPVARGRALAAAIPGATLHLLEGAGHLVQEDAPAELAAALGAFLRAERPGASGAESAITHG